MDEIVILTCLVVESTVDDADLDKERGSLQVVKLLVIEGLLVRVDDDRDNEKHDSSQWLDTWANGSHEYHQKHQDGFSQEQDDFPIVVLVVEAIGKETQLEFEARLQIHLNLGIWVEFDRFDLFAESFRQSEAKERHSKGVQD